MTEGCTSLRVAMVAPPYYDIVHDYTLAGPLTGADRRAPTVVTMHGPLDGEPGEYHRQFGKNVSLVAISESQRSQAPDLNWIRTVYNGIRVSDHPFRTRRSTAPSSADRFPWRPQPVC